MGKNQDLGSRINIPDPQHWILYCKSVFIAVNASLGWLNNVSGFILSLTGLVAQSRQDWWRSL
jgi:hypothetical protein